MEDKQQQLFSILREMGEVLVAYSGGTDSAYLAWAANQALGDRSVAITADSASIPESHKRDAIDFARSSILVLLEIIAPCMLTALVVGLGIGLLQALTQIQEQTLIYAPKILAIFVSLLIFLPLMGALLTGFMHHIAERISSL